MGRSTSLTVTAAIPPPPSCVWGTPTQAQRDTFHSMGDVNYDGIIDTTDAALIQEAFYSRPGDANWNPYCDLNGDGIVNLEDALIVSTNNGLNICTYFKGPTILNIDSPSPSSGNVPFTVTISGRLTDGAGNGLGGKTVNIYWDGVLTNTVLTNSNPLTGWIGIWWGAHTVTTAGTHTIYAEFAGDADYEGC